LIARLRQIYRDQGIEVPDQVLAEGVTALRDSRFVYTPPAAGWKRTLLTLWVKRQMHSKRLGIAAAALIALFQLPPVRHAPSQTRARADAH